MWRRRQSKRDRAHNAPLDQVTWIGSDGIRYLNPEIALFFKANSDRATQQWDWDIAYPLLSAEQRRWLDDAVERQRQGLLHPATA